MATKGGRIPPDGRPAQAKGVGKNAKRHDLERPKTPGLHGSDLQQGDVQAMEQGQRIAPAATQRPAAPTPTQSTGGPAPTQQGQDMETPDAIDFFAGRAQGGPAVPSNIGPPPTGGKFEKWSGVLGRLVSSPGSSGGLSMLYVNQLRNMRQQTINRPAASVNLQDIDNGMDAMTQDLGAE